MITMNQQLSDMIGMTVFYYLEREDEVGIPCTGRVLKASNECKYDEDTGKVCCSTSLIIDLYDEDLREIKTIETTPNDDHLFSSSKEMKKIYRQKIEEGREKREKERLTEGIFRTMNGIRDVFRCGEKNGFDSLLGMRIKSLDVDQLLDVSIRTEKAYAALVNALSKGTLFNEKYKGPDFFSLLDRIAVE